MGDMLAERKRCEDRSLRIRLFSLFSPAPRLDIRGFRFRPRFLQRRWTFDDLDIRIADRRRLALARLPTAY